MRYLILIVITCSILSAVPLETCNVKIEALQGEYQGGCRKGLAHGQGTAIGEDYYKGQFKKGLPHGKGFYRWKDGAEYEGFWKKGMRHGEGTLKYTTEEERDTVLSGIWEEDEYMGEKKLSDYKIIRKQGTLSRVKFQHMGEGDAIRVQAMLNGMPNTDLEALVLFGSSGTQTNFGQNFGWSNVEYPFRGKIQYRSWNSIRSARSLVTLEFEINKAGNWQLVLFN